MEIGGHGFFDCGFFPCCLHAFPQLTRNAGRLNSVYMRMKSLRCNHVTLSDAKRWCQWDFDHGGRRNWGLSEAGRSCRVIARFEHAVNLVQHRKIK